MNLPFALGAIAALAVGTAVDAGESTMHVPIDIGTFANMGVGHISYQGSFEQYVSAGPAAGPGEHTVISVDLAGILTSLDYESLVAVTVIDAGYNMYGPLSPGADIDLLAFDGLTEDVDVTFAYDGPNPVHQGESPSRLARRVGEIDSFSGAQDAWHLTHASLGDRGALTAFLGHPQPAFAAPTLLVSEAGSVEFFRIRAQAIVPAPGSVALFAMAALAARRSRRRRDPRSRSIGWLVGIR